MKKAMLRIISAGVAVLLTASLFAGCGGRDANNNQNDANATGEAPKKSVTLKIWSPLDSKTAQTLKSYADQAAFKEIEKQTGVKIEWMHPPVGQEKDQLSLILSSMELPDMIYYNWTTVPGGPEKIIQDGIIINLNDTVGKNAPNLNQIFQKYPEIHKQAITDSGVLYCFPKIANMNLMEKGKEYLANWLNPQMRKDWLDKLNLGMPETIDEWEKVLAAFKNNDLNGNGKADEIPFVSTKDTSLRYLATSWGMMYDFYLGQDGKVKFGPYEPAFKDYVSKLRDWYAKGLIDRDYLATDDKGFKAKVTGEQAGAYIGSGGGNYQFFLTQMKDKNPDFKLTAAKWPAGPAGKNLSAQAGVKNICDGSGLAITSKTKNAAECAKWADFLYGDQGVTVMNWGIRDVSYKEENGKKIYTDEVAKNPKGLDADTAMSQYAMGGTTGWAGIQDWTRLEHSIFDIQKMGAYYEVNKTASMELILPPIVPTAEESTKSASIMTQINTYRDEMFNKFVMGQESMDQYDGFVKKMKDMGIEEVLKIQNAALDRYNKRK